MKTKHPALEVFSEFFEKAATQERPDAPTNWVPRNWFHAECKRRGIDVPEGFIAAIEWEEEIGLRKHVGKLLRDYRKRTCTQPGPTEMALLKGSKLK